NTVILHTRPVSALQRPTLISLFFFFFHGYAPSRDLHSFPTRRSSDLAELVALGRRCAHSFCHGWTIDKRCRQGRSGKTSSRLRRSEEHTSELQSRGHLVCRLLLEKKTKQHT